MVSVSGELTSLSICVEALRVDSGAVICPVGMGKNLISVLKSCDVITRDMTALIHRLSSGDLARKIRQTASSQSEMNKLRVRIESHKSDLDITLESTSF